MPAASTQQVATHTLCLRCALAFQQSQTGNGSQPGYASDGARWQFEPGQTADGRFPSYQPTDHELQWWTFLSWLIATGRVSVGQDEGAELVETPEQR
ncbi:hypothetical protein [Sphaerobacter sp.]|uniref:hypothetical protein n=1 Tax=Sphaerobacter sp. TaxID=2099654 RepID=UPI001D629B50|nr:hypothetical protein [Sphaerobacter sp.]MBX5445348.1 hypothetical protein [Sphaerobacter sp.]